MTHTNHGHTPHPSTVLGQEFLRTLTPVDAIPAPVPAKRNIDTDSTHQHTLQRIARALDKLTPTLVQVLHAIHARPEIAYREHFASTTIADTLREAGIAVQHPAYGLDTALVASIQGANYHPEKHRSIAILSEYDALAGIGHGCGHNVIAAAGLGAFLALATVLAENPHAYSGRVVYLGTPAEESNAGKEELARAGAFNTVDAAIMVHPYFADVADQTWLGRRECRITFTGAGAHASSHPFVGRNALDAATLAYQGIGLARQQLPPSERIHAIINNGGQTPNLIPDMASLHLNIRAKHPASLKALSERISNIARGAALMCEVQAHLDWDQTPPTMPVRANKTLTERWILAQQARGRTPWPAGTISETLAASTDFGNISVRIPAIHPLIKIAPEGTGMHTKEFARAAQSPEAEKACIDAAYGLAAVALDFIADNALALTARREFMASGGEIDPQSYLHPAS